MSLFRQEALDHRRAAEETETLKVSPPWSWAMLIGLGTIVVAFLGWAVVGKVPVTERAQGIIQPVGGARVLAAGVAGRVARLRVKSGQAVKTGDLLLEIEAPSVAAPALVATRDRAMAKDELGRLISEQERNYIEQRRRITDRIREAQDQLASLQKSQEMQGKKVAASEALFKAQLLAALQVDDAREAMEGIRRQQQAVRQSILTLQQERTALDALAAERSIQIKRDLARVEAAAEGQEGALGQSIVAATTDGIVEGIVVHEGDTVQVGDELARIVPAGANLEVVAFLPERHEAFLRPGNVAYLEIEQLPYGEFGSAEARIQRVGHGAASSREIQAILGVPAVADAAMVRVDLAIKDDAPARRAGVPLKAGMRAQVRFRIRRHSLAAMIFAPLRRWLD